MKLDIIWLDSAKHVGDTGWVNGFNPFPINYSHKSCGFATTEPMNLTAPCSVTWPLTCAKKPLIKSLDLKVQWISLNIMYIICIYLQACPDVKDFGMKPKCNRNSKVSLRRALNRGNEQKWMQILKDFGGPTAPQVQRSIQWISDNRNGECWEKQQFSMKLKVWFGEWKIVSVKFSTLVLVYVKLDWLSWHFLLLSIFGPGNPATVWWNMTMWGRHLMPTRATQFQLNHSRSWKRIQRKDALKHGFD